MNHSIIFLTITLAVITIASLTTPSYGAFVGSPMYQLQSGVAPEDILCKENKLLVLRSNGMPACVSEKTSERMGWEIINPSIVILVLENENTDKEKEIIIEKNNMIKVVKENENTKEKNSWIRSVTDLSYMDLERIPNPTGYWVPIDDLEKFTNALVSATGDKLSNVNKFGKADYYTENGRIHVSDFYLKNAIRSSVHYQMYDSFSLVDETKQLPFINNFMNNMGFKLDNNKLSITEDFLETCEGNYYYRLCVFEDKSSISTNVSADSISYKLESLYSSIEFIFYDKGYTSFGQEGISIKFDGWTNNPELVQHPLGEKDANDLVRKFILSTEYFNKLGSDGGTCEAQLDKSIHINPIVISGIPFYESEMARCTFALDNTGMYDWPIILVDGWTGEYLFQSFRGGQD